ncbi:class I SAM-dependent methyltransferase, partial [Alphaproteobacteria bacterium]|nr:class I SAM-dependent methyltransferase [Alphaproteobacteria bacterium]
MKCKICDSSRISEVLDLGKQPLANKYPKDLKQIKSEKKFSLKILFCKYCKAAQIKKIVNRNLLFEDYYYLSSVNKKLRKHFEDFSKKLTKYKFIVDIGSNDGILLKPLKKLKLNAIGIDPSINVGKIANDQGLKTYIGFFDKPIIKKILKIHPKPDLIVASSVVTHLDNPKKFAKNIKYFLKSKGDVIIEIEYLQNFLKNLEFERFYFDRPFYYSAYSINIMFRKVGMSLYDIEKIEAHGGSLRCYIKNSVNYKKTARCKKILSDELKKLNLTKFKLFKKEITKEAKIFKEKLFNLKKEGEYIIGYGAPARVSTITNFANIDLDLIRYI